MVLVLNAGIQNDNGRKRPLSPKALDNFKVFKCAKNGKEPVVDSWKNTKNHVCFSLANFATNNYGVPCGTINNIFVVDVDVKDQGLAELNKYTDQNGPINTFTVRTQSGGLHFYFRYQNESEETQEIIKKCGNWTKLRGKGLDIRTSGGYVIAPNSSINNKFYVVENNQQINEIPIEFLHWLLRGRTINKKLIIQSNNTNIKYLITDGSVERLLEKVPNEYLESYEHWLKVTTVCKNLNAFDIWDNWSRKSLKYDQVKNMQTWNHNKGVIDVNYLIAQINKIHKQNIPFIKFVKELPNRIKCPNGFNVKNVSDQYLFDNATKTGLNFKIYDKTETLLIESGTGTGKTSTICQHIKQDCKNSNKKMISIVSKRSLGKQHKTDLTENGLEVNYYEDCEGIISKDQHNIICINSLLRLERIPDKELQDYVILIDEISLFLNDVTHNETLKKQLKPIFCELMRLIEGCGKLILMQNDISENVFNFIENRKAQTKLFYSNDFKTNSGKKCYFMKSENEFMKRLKQDVKDNKYFLIAFDSKTEEEYYLNELMQIATEEQKQNFISINRDSTFDLVDAKEQFKNKFVFYTPSIIFGVDALFLDSQNQYLHVKGKTINTQCMYQQAMRTRNIKELFVYCDDETCNKPEFDDLADCFEYYQNISQITSDMTHSEHDLLYSIGEDNKMKLINNTFTKMFINNVYINDILKTNIYFHLFKLFSDNGFVCEEVGTRRKLYGKKKIKDVQIEYNKELLQTYIQDENKNDEKYSKINDVVDLVGIKRQNKEFLMAYSDVLLSKDRITEHFNTLKHFYTDEAIENKMEIIKHNNFDVCMNETIYFKQHLIRKLEKKFNINRLDVGYSDDGPINMTDEEFAMIKKCFRTSKQKPMTKQEFKPLYISFLKHQCDNVIDSKRDFTRIKGEAKKTSKRNYLLDAETIEKHLVLAIESDRYKNKIDVQLIAKIGFDHLHEYFMKDSTSCHFIDDLDDIQYLV